MKNYCDSEAIAIATYIINIQYFTYCKSKYVHSKNNIIKVIAHPTGY